MEKNRDTQMSGAYFVRSAGKVIAGGVFEIEDDPKQNRFRERIGTLKDVALRHLVKSFTPEIAAESMILTSPETPGVELIIPRNTRLTAQMVREVLQDVYYIDLDPKSIPVKPNPLKS